jgi:phosphohistidine phosphatase
MTDKTSRQVRQRQLVVLRHAKSSWSEPGMADVDRPLNDRGRANAALMGRKLRDERIAVDIILASTATRVRETLDLLLPAWKRQGPLSWEKCLYLATPETILHQLAALDNDWRSAMVVGHNPGLSELVEELTGDSIELPTAAIVVLQSSEEDWPAATRSRPWQQLAFWKPKEH